MTNTLYATIGVIAISWSVVQTAYRSYLSYEHFQCWLGPIIAISACILLAIAGLILRKHLVMAVVFGVLGIAFAVVSGSVVVDRTVAGGVAIAQDARNENHAKAEAERTLADAKVEVQAAVADAKEVCSKPRFKTACRAAEKREAAARDREQVARTKSAGAGAKIEVDPSAVQMALLLSITPVTYRLVQSASPGALLEACAPLLMGFGLFALGIAIWPQGAPPVVAPLANSTPAPRANRTPSAPMAPTPMAPDGTAPSAPTAPRARKRKGKGASANGTKRGSNSKAYILERLERVGRHDLARAVRAGQMSAAAGAKLGFRLAAAT